MHDLDDLLMISDNQMNLFKLRFGFTFRHPLQDVIKHFRAEVEAHIKLQVCPNGICSMSRVLRTVHA